MKNEKLPNDMKESEIVTIYKQKGDALECGNYMGIKLLEIALKIYERVTKAHQGKSSYSRKSIRVHAWKGHHGCYLHSEAGAGENSGGK